MKVNSGIRIKGTGEPNVYGKIIGYECLKSGYVLIGSATSRCDETGNWNPGSPFCVKKAACEYPGPLTNGIVQEEQKEYKIDSEVTYYCNPGFTLVGERTSKCVFQEKEMKWSTSLPSCESGKCKNPEVRHGIRLTGLDSFHAYGQTVTYECKIGYYMVGSYISRCEENGTWYPKIPTCEKISPEVCGAPFIVNGTVQMLLSTYVIGMGITIICNEDNSFLDDTTEMTTECLGYNVWDPPVKPCLSTTSPDISPLTIYNGAIIEGKKRHYRPGDSVVVSCNAGYTLIGPSTIRYIGGKKWTPYMPTCSLNFLLVMLIIGMYVLQKQQRLLWHF
nr:C4b-binding protein alpha chain-like [Anolis sagrei ordinatus]